MCIVVKGLSSQIKEVFLNACLQEAVVVSVSVELIAEADVFPVVAIGGAVESCDFTVRNCEVSAVIRSRYFDIIAPLF